MDKEHYDKLPTDQKWIISKTWLDIVQATTSARMGLLPLIAGICAALLVVATFNAQLITSETIRVVITIFLVMIPISLYFYNDDLKTTQEKARAELDKLHGRTPTKTEWKNIKERISAILPDAEIYILTLLIVVLIGKIWGY